MLAIGPVRVALGGEIRDVVTPKRRRVAFDHGKTPLKLTFAHDLNTQAGSIRVEGNLNKVEDFLKLSAAFGRQVKSWLGIERTGGCDREVGVEAATRRPVEWQDWLYQSKSDGGRVEPAAEHFRRCVGLDRRAAHRPRCESRRVWRDVDGQHRGNGKGR